MTTTDRKPDPRAAVLAEQITAYFNRGGNSDDLADALNNDHPTLQQRVMNGFYTWVKTIAARDSRFFDARNQATKNFCDAVVAREDELRPWFPFI